MSNILSYIRWLMYALGAALAAFYYQWGMIYARWGQANRAFWYMSRALRLNPRSSRIYFSRASLFLAVGRPEQAVQDFSEAIRLNPRFTDAYTSRGMMYTLLGRDEEAQQDVEHAVEFGADRVKVERQMADLRRIP